MDRRRCVWNNYISKYPISHSQILHEPTFQYYSSFKSKRDGEEQNHYLFPRLILESCCALLKVLSNVVKAWYSIRRFKGGKSLSVILIRLNAAKRPAKLPELASLTLTALLISMRLNLVLFAVSQEFVFQSRLCKRSPWNSFFFRTLRIWKDQFSVPCVPLRFITFTC